MVPAYVTSRTEPPPAAPAPAAQVVVPTDAGNDITVVEIEAHVREVAVRYGISPLLVAAIIEAESEFNPRAVSRKGARGLMQLMPGTALSLQVEDSSDPYENIEAGVRHLRRLMDRFNGNLPLVLAAYNAGERAVIIYRGVPPYRETRRYVARILRRIGRSDLLTRPIGRLSRVVVTVETRRRSFEVRTMAAMSPLDVVSSLNVDGVELPGLAADRVATETP